MTRGARPSTAHRRGEIVNIDSIAPGMQDGDLIFARGRSLTSLLIRWWTTSPFCHVGVIVWDDVDGKGYRPHVIEAHIGRKVSLVPLEKVIRELGPVDYFALACPKADRFAIAKRARSFVGWKYAPLLQFLRSFSIASRCVFDLLRVSDDIAPGRTHCSEIASASLADGGCELEGGKDPAKVTPGDVALSICYQRRGMVTL